MMSMAACAATNSAASAPVAAPVEAMSKVDDAKAAVPAVTAVPAATQAPSPQPTAQPAAAMAEPTAMPAPTEVPVSLLPNEPIAPVIQSDTWINVTQPIVWDSLRGQVAMVEFWTFGCINCQHVLPQLKQTYADYKDRGFTIVSVHSPEFDHEKDIDNVRAAVKREGIEYPVAIDNDFANWRRYRNRYWPAWYLVDKRGVIRFTHVGEGGDAETRQWIETLLVE